MKKLLAILLALMLVLVNVAALAEGEGNTGDDTGNTGDSGTTTTAPITPGIPADTKTIKITKAIIVNDGATSDKTKPVTPAQTITFTVGNGVVTDAATGTTAPTITIDDAVFAAGATEKEININIATPGFTSVGIYTYAITETINGVAGMGDAPTLELKITVVNGDSGLVLGGIALRANNKKTDTIENTYDAGSLKVSKKVTGNLGDKTKPFDINVTFKAPTGKTVYGDITVEGTGKVEDAAPATIAAGEGWTEKTVKVTLTDSQNVTFFNIPADVTYTIAEADYTTDANGKYDTPTYSKETGKIAQATADECEVTNNKDIEIDTGVALDTLPYVLLIALAVVSLAVLKARKREN